MLWYLTLATVTNMSQPLGSLPAGIKGAAHFETVTVLQRGYAFSLRI